MTIDDVLLRFTMVKRVKPNEWTADCPAHQSASHESLRITAARDKTLLHCFGGCATDAVLARAGLTISDLFLEPRQSSGAHRRTLGAITHTYDYTDEHGALLYQVVRYEPKDFRQRRPDGAGGWIWKLDGVRRVLYQLQGLPEQRSLAWVEGEKDCDRLWAIGIPAATTAQGAAGWRPEYRYADQAKALGLERVVLIPDHDPSGQKYAHAVGRDLQAAGIDVHVLALPDLAPHHDVSDWLDAGHTADELRALMTSAPAYRPDDEPATTASGYLQTLAEFLAEEDPPVTWIIEDLLPTGVIMLLHGEPRARKSLAAFELALAAATGTPAFGLARLMPPSPARVLYVQEEDARGLTRTRLRALVGDRCGAEAPMMMTSIRKGVNLDDPLWQEQLRTDITRLGIQLLVLDAARRLSAKTDEGPQKVRELTGVLRSLITTTGVTIIIVHHDVKPAVTGDTRRRSQRASGGDWFAACECPVHVERVTAAESLLFPEDYKFSADPAPFTFVTVVRDKLVVRLEGTDTTSDQAEHVGKQGKVLEWLRANATPTVGATKRMMKEGGLGRWDALLPVLDALLKAGKIDAVPGRQKGSLRYYVPAPPPPTPREET